MSRYPVSNDSFWNLPKVTQWKRDSTSSIPDGVLVNGYSFHYSFVSHHIKFASMELLYCNWLLGPWPITTYLRRWSGVTASYRPH